MKVKFITIHPFYVHNQREQTDIALIEIIGSFDFNIRGKVSPICLPGGLDFCLLISFE